MSKQKYLLGELNALRIPVIASSKQFQDYWNVQKQLIRLKERELLTPELQKHCDKEVREKILREDNEYLGIILHASLKSMISYLEARNEDRFRIHVYLAKDSYVPDWEGITILIKVSYRNFHARMRVWRELENRMAEIVAKFRKSRPFDRQEIDEANENIATTIEEF